MSSSRVLLAAVLVLACAAAAVSAQPIGVPQPQIRFSAWDSAITLCQASIPGRADYCCPRGCGTKGVCVRNVGCQCLPGWSTKPDCSQSFFDFVTRDARNFMIVFINIVIFLLIINAVLNTLFWIGKGAAGMVWAVNFMVLLFAVFHQIYWAYDPFTFMSFMPVFLFSWWYNMLFTCAIGVNHFVACYWHKVSAESGGEGGLITIIAKPIILIVLFVCMAIFQLAGAIYTSQALLEWHWMRVYQIIFLIFAVVHGLVFGIQAKMASRKDSSNTSLNGVANVAVFNGLFITLLALLHLCYYNTWVDKIGQAVNEPGQFWGLTFMLEMIVCMMCFASLYAVRANAIEKALSKLPGRSYEEPFSPGSTSRVDAEDVDNEARYKGGRGGLDRGAKSDATKVEYPDTSSLSLQRDSANAEQTQDSKKKKAPRIDATSDSTRDW